MSPDAEPVPSPDPPSPAPPGDPGGSPAEGALSRAIADRRSVRRFSRRPVPPDILPALIAAACAAPAPHHTRPWRFISIASPDAKSRLIDAMAAAWREDLKRDRQPPAAVEKLLARSRRELADAPLLLLACLSLKAARPWPDERRRSAERDMFVQSLGAALQNLLLAAHARGLGAYLKGAPLFCRPAVAAALDLPPHWEPAFFVLLGYPDKSAAPPPRPALDINDFLLER